MLIAQSLLIFVLTYSALLLALRVAMPLPAEPLLRSSMLAIPFCVAVVVAGYGYANGVPWPGMPRVLRPKDRREVSSGRPA
jgi:hypothetical protein